MERKELTIRAIIIGVLGSIVVAMSSTYIALRMGALPWPTVFVALTSFAVLKSLGNTSVNEINVAHTAMSAGGLVAGGLAFTIPGLWMTAQSPHFPVSSLLLVTLAGTVWGVIFTGLIRKYMIEDLKLTFPLGIAAAETLKVSMKGGVKGLTLAVSFVLSGLWAAVRDWTGKIPAVVTFGALQKRNFFVGFALYPMALGIGFIIGPLYTLTWFVGSVISYVLAVPIMTLAMGRQTDFALTFVKMFGIGMIIGGGIAVTLMALLRGKRGRVRLSWPGGRSSLIALIVLGLVLLPFNNGVPFGVWLAVLLLAAVVALIAGGVDGMTGIDPMEVLAILVVLAVKLLWHGDMFGLFMIAAFVAIVAGLAGDALQDMKAGFILGTSPRSQLISEFAGALVGGMAAVLAILALHRAYGAMGPGTPFPAPQAFAVRSMIGGLQMPKVFAAGLIIGLVIQFLNVPAMVLGIGIYLPMVLSIPVAIGGLVRWLAERKKWDMETGTAIAAGMLGGEGFSGIVVGFLKLLLH